jgi:hypothetical protein
MARWIIFTLLLLNLNLQAQSYYEMRTYTCHPNKRPDLIARFKNHTIKLFNKHGIKSVAYFIPSDTVQNSLTFILQYPSEQSRDILWNHFANDPEWKAAAAKSEANGKLVAKVDQTFMTMADELSTRVAKTKKKQEKIFELRIYTCLPDRLDALTFRFRDHTRTLFERHGMQNIVYWKSVEKNGQQPQLIYLLAHKSEKTAKASFDSFVADPDWIKARDASEASGKIVQNIESIYFKALPFSPLQ